MVDPVPISTTGFARLKAELSELEKELTRVRADVAAARELGDLKEKRRLSDGRQQQGFDREADRRDMVRCNRSDIVDCTKVECDKADFGTVVTLLDLDTQEKVTYQLLGPDEADCDTGSISIHSPVGEAILGLEVGEKVTVTIPRGDRNFEVIDIGKSEFE